MYEPLASFRPIAIPIAQSISRALNETIGSAYNPLSLFAAGEQGVWYDPSDMSTLFQDAAGTIPVTTAGQPVGLMRDKSGRGNHATQTTATSRPILQTSGGLLYLAFDGIDDGMLTRNINFSGTDEMTVFAGALKGSDAAIAFIMETSTDATINNGAIMLRAPSMAAPNFMFGSRGTASSNNTVAPFPAPLAAVITGQAKISTDANTVRINGVQAGSITANQGAANYGNYPLYIGRRANVAFPFTGNLYGLIVRGVKSTDDEIAQTEKWMNGKTGAY